MKSNETEKMQAGEAAFLAVLVVVLLIILPSLPLGKYGGGIAMLGVSIAGGSAYFAMHGARLRQRRQLKPMVVLAVVSAILGAAAAVAMVLLRGHWH